MIGRLINGRLIHSRLINGVTLGAVLLGSTALSDGALARTPVSQSVVVPLPPVPTGNAPRQILDKPLGPSDAGTQMIHPGMAVVPDWWQGFGSPALNDLVARALAANTDIAVAKARLAQAQAQVGVVRGGLLPQVDAGLTSERQRLSRTLSTPLTNPYPQVFSLHTAQVSVSYSPDLFGGSAARLRSAKAAAAVAQAQEQAIRNLVAGQVVLAVIQDAAYNAEIAATRDAIDSNLQVLALLHQREKLGAVGHADVAAQTAAIAAIEGALPPLMRQRGANLAALSVLLGLAPGSPIEKLPGLDDFALPGDLPLTMPADLLTTRPDVAGAAAALEGAAADVKVAMVARLPQINLSASFGGIAEDFSKMFSSGNPFWTLIGGIAAPVFHGGALKRQQESAEHALEAAKASYKGTALQAFADVSNALTALSTDATALGIAERGNDAASQSLTFARRQLELGGVGTLAVLNASATAQTARAQLVAARAARLSDTVGLFTALGGGLRQPATPDRGQADAAGGVPLPPPLSNEQPVDLPGH